jgi:hypothetical protein
VSEGDPGTSDAGGGGSFWTSLPALLTASAVLLGAVVSAVVALRSDEGGNADAAATTPASSTPVESRYFAAATRPAGRVYFEGETMFVKAAQPSRPMLALAETEALLRDVGLRARAEWVSGAKDFGVGFVCRYADAGNYYLLSVLSGGRYTSSAIGRGVRCRSRAESRRAPRFARTSETWAPAASAAVRCC